MYPREFLDINSLKFPFRGFWFIEWGLNAWKLEKENICPDHFPDFYLESSIIIKNMFIMKNLTDFRKTVETDVDPRQYLVL